MSTQDDLIQELQSLEAARLAKQTSQDGQTVTPNLEYLSQYHRELASKSLLYQINNWVRPTVMRANFSRWGG